MPKISGLYAVTPDEPHTDVLLVKVRAAVKGGARIVQYRNKLASAPTRRVQAQALVRLCQEMGALLIVNDHVDLALEIGADGVHVGRGDTDTNVVRKRLGPDRIIGVSCYNDLDNALRAKDIGASYIAFGGFFRSPTKPGTAASSLSILREAKHATGLPVVAIGGITPGNAGELIDAGADAIAVISGLFETADIQATAWRFSALFKSRDA